VKRVSTGARAAVKRGGSNRLLGRSAHSAPRPSQSWRPFSLPPLSDRHNTPMASLATAGLPPGGGDRGALPPRGGGSGRGAPDQQLARALAELCRPGK